MVMVVFCLFVFICLFCFSQHELRIVHLNPHVPEFLVSFLTRFSDVGTVLRHVLQHMAGVLGWCRWECRLPHRPAGSDFNPPGSHAGGGSPSPPTLEQAQTLHPLPTCTQLVRTAPGPGRLQGP